MKHQRYLILIFVLLWTIQELTAEGDLKGNITNSTEVDMVFVMDKSGSIGPIHFETMKKFVEMFIEYFPVHPGKTRVAIVSYSTWVDLEFNFNEMKNRECLRAAIRKIRYTNGRTATGNALDVVRGKLLFERRAGARENTHKIIYLLTDGKSNQGIDPAIPAQKLKENKKVSIVAIGVTKNTNEEELRQIASSPSNVVHIKNFNALKQLTQSMIDDLSKKCENGTTVVDECGRRCQCEKGRLVNCCRLRKEFTKLTKDDRIRYINTVKIASTDPRYKNKYEQLITFHMELFKRNIHKLEFFLPWHRWFLLQYENILQLIDCRVTLPYWDWTLAGNMPFSSDFWNPGPHGFGGDGNIGVSPGGCVRTGPFRELIWSLGRSAGGGCLKRNFNGKFPDAISLGILLSNYCKPEDFFKFEKVLRVVFHDRVHNRIGGTMATVHSAAAPEYALIQAFVDKIWSDWQKKDDKQKERNSFFTSQKKRLPGTKFMSKDFLELGKLPDCECVEYVDVDNDVTKALKNLTLSELQDIPRVPLPPLSANDTQLFQTSSSEFEEIVKLYNVLAPKNVLNGTSLNGTDAELGFRLADLKAAAGI